MSTARPISRRCSRADRRLGPRRGARLFRGDLDDIAGLEKLLRVLRHAVDLHLVMDVRPGAAAGAAEQADLLAHADMLAGRHHDAVEMGIACDNARAVVDIDDATELALRAGEDHGAWRRAEDGRFERRR